jgi:hypothetical protein
MGFGTLTANKASTIGGNLTLLNGASLTHANNTTTEANKIDLTIGGDFHLGDNASINVDYLGYNAGSGPGYGPYAWGASHGGQGGAGTGPAKDTYGSIVAPTNIGSGGTTGADGGGAIRIAATGEARLYGYISANGEPNGSYNSTGAGGSIFITASNLVGDAALEAEGGSGTAYGAAGGGRISLVSTLGTSFDQITARVRGGTSGSTTDGANGTIYREIGADGSGGGTALVDCDGRSPDSSGYDSATTVLPDTGYVTDELTAALLVVSNANTHMRVMADLYVGDLLVYDSTTITLGIYTMYVDSAEHHLDDRAQPNAGGPTNNVDDYSHIVWIGAYPGTVIMFQ